MGVAEMRLPKGSSTFRYAKLFHTHSPVVSCHRGPPFLGEIFSGYVPDGAYPFWYKGMREKKNSIDMLHGPITAGLTRFALPVAATGILQQLFNSADVAVVGQYCGGNAMAAVGANGPVINFLVNLFMGLSVGGNVVIARYLAQNNEKKANEAVHTLMTSALFAGLFLALLGFFLAAPIQRLLGAPADVFDGAVLYLQIYFCGMPFFMVYNFAASVLRSVGDTKRPMIILAISGLVNVLLNLLFVIVLDLSVAGVALATISANALSAFVLVMLLRKEEEALRLKLTHLGITGEHLRAMAAIGIPAGFQGMLFSVSNMCVTSGLYSLGADAVAGSAAASIFDVIAYYMANGFSTAVVTFTSQNYAYGNEKRCKSIFIWGMTLGFLASEAVGILFFIFRQPLVRIYTNEARVMAFAIIRIICVALPDGLCALQEVPSAALRGRGHSLIPALATIFGTCILRFVWVYTIFEAYPTMEVLMLVYPVTWIVTSILITTAYLVMVHKDRRAGKNR